MMMESSLFVMRSLLPSVKLIAMKSILRNLSEKILCLPPRCSGHSSCWTSSRTPPCAWPTVWGTPSVSHNWAGNQRITASRGSGAVSDGDSLQLLQVIFKEGYWKWSIVLKCFRVFGGLSVRQFWQKLHSGIFPTWRIALVESLSYRVYTENNWNW